MILPLLVLPSSFCHWTGYYIYYISLTLSRHFSLSFIASGRSSRLHPVSSHSCCMYVRAGRPAFGVHRCTSLMSSSLLFQQCPACLVRLTWIVFVMGGRWPYKVTKNFRSSYLNNQRKESYLALSLPLFTSTHISLSFCLITICCLQMIIPIIFFKFIHIYFGI